MTPRPRLGDWLPSAPIGAGEILDRFLVYVDRLGFTLYPAQERALLEVLSDRHVILDTPTGSGKSLVATFLHFRALCRGETSYYTSPTKALASEKFFTFCADFGAERVGMMTGDAAINRRATLVCCTAEILANLALGCGSASAPASTVMDEFHYYSDRERGVAWQVPLIAMRTTQFLLMSATMGDTRDIAARVEKRSGRHVAIVSGSERPVPLDYEWRDTPIQSTVEWLVRSGKAPVYVVNFTHHECAQTAQALTSANVSSRDDRRLLALSMRHAAFDTPYGQELKRLLHAGIAVHHAGLLPKYRLLVEQLAQRGLLKVVCGTDTLGVGVNIPIRTVLFAKLVKYDGRRVRVLAARDFRQIAGRAGRRGFDERGSVVCQAPEHVVDARRKLTSRRSMPSRRSRLPKGRATWNRQTFEQLIQRPPEKLVSTFRVTHGMIIQALRREEPRREQPHGYGAMVDLILHCHENRDSTHRLLREAADLFRSLRRAGLIEIAIDDRTARARALVSPHLQEDFSLHQALSLYLVDAVAALDHDSASYALDVVSLAEAIAEDPKAILAAQLRRARAELLARLRADGLSYEERRDALESVSYARPLADYIERTIAAFAVCHPWVTQADIAPKSIAREMLETSSSFGEYVRHYDLQRSEGVLLRHLHQVYKTLDQTVPQYDKTEALLDKIAFLRYVVASADDSLGEEWERLLADTPGDS